ncbi:MAG: hypothetical protein AAF702_42510 [Chloroflexota bacterium]
MIISQSGCYHTSDNELPTWDPLSTSRVDSAHHELTWHPTLPSSLYFIQEMALWRWDLGSKLPQRIVSADSYGPLYFGKLAHPTFAPGPVDVTSYRLAVNEQNLIAKLWRPSTPESTSVTSLVAVNPTTHVSVTLVTSDASSNPIGLFDITVDGKYLLYHGLGLESPNALDLGNRTQSASTKAGGLDYGAIFAMEISNSANINEVGYCDPEYEESIRVSCERFAQSPDGKQFVFADGRGVWLADIPAGNPRLIAKHQYKFPESLCGIWGPVRWSPKGRKLLIGIGCFEGGMYGLMDVDTGEVQTLEKTFAYVGSHAHVAWSLDGDEIVVARATDMSSHLYTVPAEDTSQITSIISGTIESGGFIPMYPQFLPDGKIAFANQKCDGDPGAATGLYSVTVANPEPVLIEELPSITCDKKNMISRYDAFGRILWSERGDAYLHFRNDGQRTYQPHQLGLVDGSYERNVEEILSEADSFSLTWSDE